MIRCKRAYEVCFKDYRVMDVYAKTAADAREEAQMQRTVDGQTSDKQLEVIRTKRIPHKDGRLNGDGLPACFRPRWSFWRWVVRAVKRWRAA